MDTKKLLKVLVVEDQRAVRETVRMSIRTLRDFQHEIHEAVNGEDGLKILADGLLPDIIISDIMMPVMDGIEFCGKVKESLLWCTIPFIFLTARTNTEDLQTGLSAGAIAYLKKPFDPRELSATIRSQVLSHWSIKNSFSNVLLKSLGIFAHESGTALTGILGFTRLLQMIPDQTNEQEKWIEHIITSANRLNRLRKKTISLIELHHTTKIHREPLKPSQLYRSLMTEMEKEFEGKTILIRDDSEERDLINANSRLLSECLRSIFENALKFNTEDQPIILSVQKRNAFVIFSIQDHGSGLTKERRNSVLEPFVTTSSILNHKEGTGLSLAITKRIMELHIGKILLVDNSDDTQGLTCELHVPLYYQNSN